MLKIKLFGIEFGLDFTFAAVVAMFAVLDTTGFALMSLIVCAIHEAGHLVAMAIHKQKPSAIILQGGGIKIAAHMPFGQSASVLLAGSAANLSVFAVMYAVLPFPYTNIYPIMFAVLNFVIGVFNLLPIGCLDGKRLLALITPPRVLRAVEAVAIAAVVGVLVVAFGRGGVNFTLAAAMIYVISVDFFERVCYDKVCDYSNS
jgi:Zn-dependent protease